MQVEGVIHERETAGLDLLKSEIKQRSVVGLKLNLPIMYKNLMELFKEDKEKEYAINKERNFYY